MGKWEFAGCYQVDGIVVWLTGMTSGDGDDKNGV